MAPVFSSFLALARAAARRAAALWQARRNRRAFTELAGWDDHRLADIGLSRSSVVGALEVGFLQDPSRIVTEGSRHPSDPADAPQTIPVPLARPAAMPAGAWAY